MRLTVPEVELASARDPRADRYFAIATIGFAAPWIPEMLRPFVARGLWTERNLLDGLGYSQRNVRRLYEAGVPIVVGTDAPSPWDMAIYHFHGPTTVREIELLGQAGLPPLAAVLAATRTPAKMLGMDAELGTVEVGRRADLVIVRDDPLQDLGALRTIRWTVRTAWRGLPRNGCRRPEGLPPSAAHECRKDRRVGRERERRRRRGIEPARGDRVVAGDAARALGSTRRRGEPDADRGPLRLVAVRLDVDRRRRSPPSTPASSSASRAAASRTSSPHST